jgi:two-component system, OmpR family, response regulator QseB
MVGKVEGEYRVLPALIRNCGSPGKLAMRILLIEDDEMIGEGAGSGLRQDGFVVDWVQDGEAAELALSIVAYDVVLLDLGLPKKSGLELLRGLRSGGSKIPVLILTARDAVADRVLGLDTGADDYLVKPFELTELTARIHAVARRQSGRSRQVVEQGDLKLDLAAHLAWVKGRVLALSNKEFILLQTFMDRPGAILSRHQLEEKLYGWNEEVDSNAVEVHVHRLRKKIGARRIRTLRGVGYTLSIRP